MKRHVSKEVLSRIETDPDYVSMSHHRNSLKLTSERYPEGAPDHVIAKALGKSEYQIRAMWARVIKKLRKHMGVE